MPTTQNRSQEMYETDRPSQQPTPLGSGEYVTPVNFTEISGAYFTDPISTSNEEDSKINSERLQATDWPLLSHVFRILETVDMDVVQTYTRLSI